MGPLPKAVRLLQVWGILSVTAFLQSAPLAHSTVLENEIRAIAERQGVEGHRAVLRKFSELLLARGGSLQKDSKLLWAISLHLDG